MLSIHFKQESLKASFFLLLLLPCSESQSIGPALDTDITGQQIAQIATSPTWQALLHWDGKKHIDDEGFLLSHTDFSPEKELYATLDFLYRTDANPQCRFPARYLFLQKSLSLPSLNLNVCTELNEFEQKAPIDQLSLIYASEDISQPSSMMGHVLLKMSGNNASNTDNIHNIQISHAISFYTQLPGINLLRIIYINMIAGGKGYFTLAPYQEKLTRYNQVENRNVWEYEIDSDDFTRKLIQFHFFELKQTQLSYFFKDYNCATLTQFILTLAGAERAPTQAFGVTPADTVKSLKNANLIKSTKLIPATQWKIRMLEDSVNEQQKNTITALVRNGDIDRIAAIESPQDRFLAYQLAETYTKLQLEKNDISRQQYTLQQEKIDYGESRTPAFDIDLSDYKNPTKSLADSQLTLGAFQYFGEEYLTLGVLPAAHKLEDDNSQYFGETELALGELQLASSIKDGSAFVNSFSLYSVTSLIPRDGFSGGMSGKLKIGMEHQADKAWKKHSAYYVEGALGSTLALGDDMSVYGLVGTGLTSSNAATFITGSPEIGLIIKEIFAMKSVFNARRTWTNSATAPTIDRLTFTQAFYLGGDWAAFLETERISIDRQSQNQYSLWLKKYF